MQGEGKQKSMIRPAKEEDFQEILDIYAYARAFMKRTGNPGQWGDTHPPAEMLRQDIVKKQLYVREAQGELSGVFAFLMGPDITYNKIEDGSWRWDMPYGVIHRIAGRGRTPGVFSECISFCREKCPHLRIDTHFDNKVMQHLLEKNGFERRGIIYVEDGTPRIAYDSMMR